MRLGSLPSSGFDLIAAAIKIEQRDDDAPSLFPIGDVLAMPHDELPRGRATWEPAQGGQAFHRDQRFLPTNREQLTQATGGIRHNTASDDGKS